MKTSDFSFDLPDELIAQQPVSSREKSRLMVLDRRNGERRHMMFSDLPDILPVGGCLVFNDSRVRKVRVFGINEETGGRVEFFLIRSRDQSTWEALCQKSQKQQPGKRFRFPGSQTATIVENLESGMKLLRFASPVEESWLDNYGHLPLPPYIRREDTLEDQSRYQTVYAAKPGSLAAPTAGLHFSPEILHAVESKGTERIHITLHVGLGTFLPVRSELIKDHRMHTEQYEISAESAIRLQSALSDNKPVTAVGTTSVRTLESAWNGKRFRTGLRETDIFITPGYRFQTVSHLLTNFHTPQSTLLMLVSAFAGTDLIREAYREAVAERYRFFSYGDSMLIL